VLGSIKRLTAINIIEAFGLAVSALAGLLRTYDKRQSTLESTMF
jgi:hypothetical protein